MSAEASYHFVDRPFCRVFRIGPRERPRQSRRAILSGADQNWIYVNLNESFFGVAFEARTPREDEPSPLNPAQVYAGRILTDMLRARYGIAAENCVAHGQVFLLVRHAPGRLPYRLGGPFAIPRIGPPRQLRTANRQRCVVASRPTPRLPTTLARPAPGATRGENKIQQERRARNLPSNRYGKHCRKDTRTHQGAGSSHRHTGELP